MKVVLDTNVWLDWLIFDDPASRAIAHSAARGRLELLASAATRAEWLDVIGRPRFGLQETRRTAVAAGYDARVTLLDASPPAPGSPGSAPRPADALQCRDPDDQKFLELALHAHAAFLVTRDRALLDLHRRAWRRHGLRIARPDDPEWCEVLAAHL